MSEAQENQKSNIPRHIAIIPDGNRRWAKEKGLPTLEGHRKGAENFEHLINKARDMGIGYFTGWAFSTENWRRTEEENQYLFNLARNFIRQYKKKFLKEGIRFFHLGRKDRLPKDIVDALIEMENETQHSTDFTVSIAMDYGGHDELLRALNKIKEANLEITAENIEKHLDTHLMPPPDLIIRTSGEQRLSGFMSWQNEYSEFYFPKLYFPDFGPEELENAINEFSQRDRRFGGNTK